MSPEPYEILEGALLVSDAHYSERRPELERFLNAVEVGSIDCPQLVLMGDIFDLLFGEVAVSHRRNAPVIETINALAGRVPVLYLEGNHDYNLSGLFPSVNVVPLKKQPLRCRFGERNLFLAHGDFNQPLPYRIYTALIRNHTIMRLLDWIDRYSAEGIVRRLDRYLDRKNDCYRISDFCTFVQAHVLPLKLPEESILIEGHYHQGVSCRFEGITYFNLGAFACGGEYAMITEEERGETIALHKQFWQKGRNGDAGTA